MWQSLSDCNLLIEKGPHKESFLLWRQEDFFSLHLVQDSASLSRSHLGLLGTFEGGRFFLFPPDSDDENEMNNAAPVPTSFEMRNVMKSMHSYLDAHSNGEMNKEMDDIEQFDAKENKYQIT
ncbi:hypothetical protein TNCV_4963531 [Trichonephila clavipes]|nr:hypothetical protein TNCV_4963531 [Trichonephila clavipes]